MLKSTAVVYYLPPLLVAGTLTGLLIGIVAQKVLSRSRIKREKFFEYRLERTNLLRKDINYVYLLNIEIGSNCGLQIRVQPH